MILTTEEYNAFLEVHLGLLYYTGKKYHLLKAVTSLQDFKDSPLEDKFGCREYFNDHPGILEEYVKLNQDKLSSGQKRIL